MWFTSVFLKTFRECRAAILGWGIGMGLLMLEVQVAAGSLLSNATERSTLTSLTGSFNWAGDPVAVDTVGGYATWKNAITLTIMAIWPLIAASRILRGAEERGSMDVLLTQPRGRLRVAVESLLAVWSALAVMGLLTALLTFAGGRAAGADYGFGDALLFGLNLVLLCGVFASLALFVSQFTGERSAASGITGALLFAFIVMDMLHRIVSGVDWISRLSPVYYYNLSKPLVPSFGTNGRAMALLFGISVLLSAAAIAMFVRRDVGRAIPLPAWFGAGARRPERGSSLPERAWSLRSVYARSLAVVALPTLWWTIGIAGFSALMVVAVRQMEDKLAQMVSGSSFLNDFLTKVGGGGAAMNAQLLGALFVFLPMLLMAFAVTQANRWAADEEEGRQELLLSTPTSRLRVLLGRFAALTTAALFIGVLTLAVCAFTARATGLALDAGNLAAATLSIIPQGLLMAALGYLFAGWLRTAVESGVLSFLLVAWFFISFIGPELGWSPIVLKLSALYYYGTPLVHGLPVGDTAIVLAVGAAALVVASIRFVRKDIGRV